MSREIKFRAWDKSCNRMFNTITEVWFGNNDYFKELFFDQDFYFKAETKNDSGVEIHQATSEDCILMQYTGLHDKNGTEIYEGDIVRLKTGAVGFYEYSEPHLAFAVRLKESDHSGDDFIISKLDGWYNLDVEVIGNLYENPELLEKS